MRWREQWLYHWLRWRARHDVATPPIAELGTTAVGRILVLSNTAIGDTLMSLPALHSLRQAYPQAEICLLVNPPYQTLFSVLAPSLVNQVAAYDGRWRDFRRQVRQWQAWRPDLVAILHSNEPQATPLAYLSGARWRFKLPNTSRFRFLLSNREPVLDWDAFDHGIQQRLAVAQLAGGVPVAARMDLPLHPDSTAAVDALLQQYRLPSTATLIGFQPGASTTSRRWPISRHIAVAKALLQQRPEVWIAITGSPTERGLAEAIVAGVADARVFSTAGALPLQHLPTLVQRMKVLLTPDTGIMHLAVAVGTPVVALFAVSDWRRSGPCQDLAKHQVIQKWRTCQPCLSKRCPHPEPMCMDLIAEQEVLQALHQALQPSLERG